MTIDEFLEHLAVDIGQPVQWSDNSVAMDFGDSLSVTFEHLPEENVLYCYSDLAVIAEKDASRYGTALLEANHFATGTGGSAVLAYDDEEEKVILWDKLLLDQSAYHDFENLITAFLITSRTWADRLRDGVLDTPSAPPAGVTRM